MATIVYVVQSRRHPLADHGPPDWRDVPIAGLYDAAAEAVRDAERRCHNNPDSAYRVIMRSFTEVVLWVLTPPPKR